MEVSVQFFSYFKDLTGCAATVLEVAESATIDDMIATLALRFPRWGELRRCALIAVGLEYQNRSYILKPGDQVSIFPPVQGG
jgi:molybdopterin converting factor small subunit